MKKRDLFIRIIKIAFGGFLAVFIANLLGLAYSTSAGVITILSIQNTRRETLRLVGRRIVAFFLALLIAYLCFNFFGYGLLAVGIFLLLFAFVCQILELQEALVMNTVLMFHFYAEQSMSALWIKNELLLLFIGTGIGILMNSYMIGSVEEIRKGQEEVEEMMRGILHKMSVTLLKESKEGYDANCFISLGEKLEQLEKYSFERRENTLLTDNRYFIKYVEMRKSQKFILKRIYDNIHHMDLVVKQAYQISELLEEVSGSLQEYNNGLLLLEHVESLYDKMRDEPLPTVREEFENRAFLYRLLHDLEDFLRLKIQFVDQLTEEEIERFWK